MPTQQIINRAIANLFFFFKRKEFRAARLKFLVFTGTVGKTTLRDTVAYALEKMVIPVYSNKLGYSNELGILLTVLGFSDFSLRNPLSILHLFKKKVPQEGFVCIELGADFYKDIPWFLKKFTPYAVFLSGVTNESWSGDINEVFEDRRSLLEKVPASGFIIHNNDDLAVLELVRKSKVVGQISSFSLDKKSLADVVTEEWIKNIYVSGDNKSENITIRIRDEEHNLILVKSLFEPQVYGLLAVYAFIKNIFPERIDELDGIFKDYQFSQNRLQILKAKNGALIIEDSYKATPLCTDWFLGMSANIKAGKRILVLTEIRPLTINVQQHYLQLAKKIQLFQQVYFLGPHKYFDILSQLTPKLKKLDINDYEVAAKEILQNSSTGDLILLKGSFRYRLESLRNLLT
jgi:UDP-N-acetylmuramyl pentapeptide synthase